MLPRKEPPCDCPRSARSLRVNVDLVLGLTLGALLIIAVQNVRYWAESLVPQQVGYSSGGSYYASSRYDSCCYATSYDYEMDYDPLSDTTKIRPVIRVPHDPATDNMK